MIFLSKTRLRAAISSAAALVALSACSGEPPKPAEPRTLDMIRESGELIVLTLDGPTTYERARGDVAGYEVDLARAVAADLGVSARFEEMSDVSSLLEAMKEGRGDVAAAGITRTPSRAENHEFGPAYKTVRQQLVCRMGADIPRQVQDMAGMTIEVVAGSSYAETLDVLDDVVEGLEWTEREAASALPLLRKVQNERIDCTVSDSNLVAVARRRFPELVTAFNLTEDQALAWTLAPGADGVEAYLTTWFDRAHRSGFLQELDERYYGRFQDFDYVEVASFIRRARERLPRYRDTFERAAVEHGFTWTLLAAQAYQESHWEPDAKSPTGVRGLMMLTRSTAQRVGVDDRLDPTESIRGGAAYLADLYARIPGAVTGEDRLWFALAAYNVGMGHIYDARAIAERRGMDKNSWDDLRENLPLLTQEEWYATTRHGYARGYEPVQYVDRIRDYQAILEGLQRI